MRSAFVNTLEKLAERNPDIFLLNGDLGFSVLEDFTKAYPGRSLNMGVAEANMMTVAAGLAMTGKKVFVYSIIPFVTARAFEQVRNDVALQNMDVKIVGVGSGMTYGQLGPTHHSIEDIAIMRALPNMTVLCPGDPKETVEATRQAAKLKGPVYLRLGKKGEPPVHTKRPKFELGKALTITNGKDCTIIATGNMLKTAVDVANELIQNKINARVISMHTIKPIDATAIKKAARDTEAIFTLEEHNIIGGLGSAVAEVVANSGIKCLFHRFGINDIFPVTAGSQNFLRDKFGLSVGNIHKVIKNKLKL
jgi:transketolase